MIGVETSVLLSVTVELLEAFLQFWFWLDMLLSSTSILYLWLVLSHLLICFTNLLIIHDTIIFFTNLGIPPRNPRTGARFIGLYEREFSFISSPTPTTPLHTPRPPAGGNSSFSFSGASVPESMREFLICFIPELNFALQFCILAIYQLQSCSSFRLNFSIIPAFYICEPWDQLDRKPRFLILEVKDTWSSWNNILIYSDSCSRQRCHRFCSIMNFINPLYCSPIFSKELWFHISINPPHCSSISILYPIYFFLFDHSSA